MSKTKNKTKPKNQGLTWKVTGAEAGKEEKPVRVVIAKTD